MIKKIILNIFFFLLCSISQSSEKEQLINSFSKIDSLSFNFKQTIDEKTENGECTILYPKKIYCSYKGKENKILVSNGKSLVIKSKKNNHYYHYPLDKTPFKLLLDKNYILEQIKRLKMELVDNKYYKFSLNSNNYIINIFFNKNNYRLIGWQTEDIYQNLVITYLYNLKINENINNKLFLIPQRD